MSLSRGPAMPGRAADVAYFAATAEGNDIFDKQVFAARADFPANTDRLNVISQEISMLFPFSADKSAAAYKIWVGFQPDAGGTRHQSKPHRQLRAAAPPGETGPRKPA